MDDAINQQRKRREFLYHVYSHAQHRNNGQSGLWPINSADTMFVYQAMVHNWGRMSNADAAPLLFHHLTQGNISVSTPFPDGGVDKETLGDPRWQRGDLMSIYPNQIFITAKGIEAVESDLELWDCVDSFGGLIDWTKTVTKASTPLVQQETIPVSEGNGSEPEKKAAQGLIALWQAIDFVCADMGWNWVKEDESKSYSKVYASPEGLSTRYIVILFNAAVTTEPQYILDPDGNPPLTATQQAEAKLFIDGVRSTLFIGLGSAVEDSYRESDFKRLIHGWIRQSEVASSEIATPKTYTQAIGRYITELDLMTVSNTEGARTTIRADSATRGPIAEYIIELRDDGFTSFTHKPLGDLDLYRQLTDRIMTHIGEVFVTAIRWDETSQAAVNLTSIAEATPGLNYMEQKIKAVYDLIVSEGNLYPTDETIAARLPMGRKGQPPARETVNRYRNRMRERGIDV